MKRGTRAITRIAIVGALYFVLTYFLQPLAYGPLQFRVAEALTLLPVLFPEAVVGLTIGCLVANIFSPYMWYDVLFGTLATATAAVLTRVIAVKLKDKSIWLRGLLGSLPPVFINAFVLPLMWLLFGADAGYWLNFALILATQAGTVLVLGIPLVAGLERTKLFR